MTGAIGVLLLLKAFASGCSALTGVEAIANAVPAFRTPLARRAQNTEVMLGAILGVLLVGLAILIRKFHVGPVTGKTVLAQRAIRRGTRNVVICRLRFSLSTWDAAPPGEGATRTTALETRRKRPRPY